MKPESSVAMMIVRVQTQLTIILISLVMISTAEAGVAGDMNCDGVRNGLDLAGFIHAIEDPKSYLFFEPDCNYFDADLDADGDVDLNDTGMFIDLLMGPADGPEATTGQFTFPESTWGPGIILEGVYSAHPEHQLKFTITELPQQGYLYEYAPSLTVIDTVPHELATNWVAYNSGSWGSGFPFANVAYTVTSMDDGAVSPVRRVAINRTPSTVPILDQINPQILEDTPVIFELNVLHEELVPPGDVLSFRIDTTVSPTFGHLYQIDPDGQTFGPPIASGQTVTNPDHLVGYIPSNNYFGNAANFTWSMQDSMGLYSPANGYMRWVTLTVNPVNDPPFATNGVAQATHLFESFYSQLSFGDWDSNSCVDGAVFSITIHTLPEHGLIYRESISPENLISNPGTTYPTQPGAKVVYQVTEPGLGSPYDHFTWSVSDGCESSAIATNTVNIVYGNSPPVPDPASPITVAEDSDYTYFTLTASDIDDGPDPIKWSSHTIPTKGTLQALNVLGIGWFTVTAPNTQISTQSDDYEITLRYKPHANVNTLGEPPDEFSFRVADAQDISAPATVQFSITAVNDAPIIIGPMTAHARVLVPSGQHVNAVITNLSVSDDAGSHTIDVALSATNANALFLNNPEVLSNFLQRSPTSMSFSGTVAQLNAALAAGLQFDPATLTNGAILMNVTDNGNTGEETPPVNHVASHQITVLVSP